MPAFPFSSHISTASFVANDPLRLGIEYSNTIEAVVPRNVETIHVTTKHQTIAYPNRISSSNRSKAQISKKISLVQPSAVRFVLHWKFTGGPSRDGGAGGAAGSAGAWSQDCGVVTGSMKVDVPPLGGSYYLLSALPSGACQPEQACGLVDVQTCSCGGDGGPATPSFAGTEQWACICDAGAWACARQSQGTTGCACPALDAGSG